MLPVAAARKIAVGELALWPVGAHLEHDETSDDDGHRGFLVLSYTGELLGRVSVADDGSVTTQKLSGRKAGG